jgi:hypothetical protein
MEMAVAVLMLISQMLVVVQMALTTLARKTKLEY